MISVTLESDMVPVGSGGAAGVATSDGRYQPIPTGHNPPDLGDGYAISYASVHRTPPAPAWKRAGGLNGACCVSPLPVRTISLVQIVFDEPPPGRTAIGSSPHRGRSVPLQHAKGASVLRVLRKLRYSYYTKIGFAAPARRTLHLPSGPVRSQARSLIGRKGATEFAGAPATPPTEFLQTH